MIKPDWKVFKAKFSQNPQVAFEWLCYLLFCKEFHQPLGIMRYVNQSGMETNPIKVADDYISWEAKFYEDKLSNHKDEYIKKLETARNKNPETTIMHFYSPIDWTESSKKIKRTTNQQEEIERYARDKNIKIVWKGASFFESPFVSIENEVIAKHFYSLEKSAFDLIIEQQVHTQNILSEIQTHITFDDQVIEIDRSSELSKLKDSSEQVLILSGLGGVGKTALIN